MEPNEKTSAADVDRWLRDVEDMARALGGEQLRTTGADASLRNGVWRAHCELAGNIVGHEAATLAGAAWGLRASCLRELGEVARRAQATLAAFAAQDGARVPWGKWVPALVRDALTAADEHGAEYSIHEPTTCHGGRITAFFRVGVPRRDGDVAAATAALVNAGFTPSERQPMHAFNVHEWLP